MGIFDYSFSIELNSPLDEESWKVIEDAEFDNTEHIWFTTPSGKQVDFIKADVLEKIRAEIKELADYDNVDALVEAVRIIDKYKAESEGK